MTASSNGASTTEKVVVLPHSVEVEVAGATIIAPATPSKKGIKYEALAEVVLDPTDTRSFEEIIGGIDAPVYDGQVMAVAEKYRGPNGTVIVRVSEPYMVNGVVKPNTGGKPTLSFIKMLPDMGPFGFMLRVTLKGIKASGGKRIVTVEVSNISRPEPKERRKVGEVKGSLTL